MACCHYVKVDGVVKRAANTQDPWIVNGAFINTTHPRTAFGISKDQKTVYLVTVDGRFSKAVNFDGGGGTAMYIYGHGIHEQAINVGIVNHPCDPQDDNKRYWNNPRLRPCGNAVYIYSDLK